VVAEIPDLGSDDPLIREISSATYHLQWWAGADVELPGADEAHDTSAPSAFPMAGEFDRMARALVAGDLVTAVTHGRVCIATEVEINRASDDLHVFWPVAARAALLADDRVAFDEMMGHVAEERDSTLPVSVRGLRKALRAAAALRWGYHDPAEVEQDLVSGIADLEAYGGVVWRAHAQEDLATLLASQGRTEEAEPLLAAARTTYAELGATTWLARIDDRVSTG
jgi:hypothetical protein